MPDEALEGLSFQDPHSTPEETSRTRKDWVKQNFKDIQTRRESNNFD